MAPPKMLVQTMVKPANAGQEVDFFRLGLLLFRKYSVKIANVNAIASKMPTHNQMDPLGEVLTR